MLWSLGDPAAWDWPSILKTVIGAGLGTGAVQGGISLYKDRALRNDGAAYLALRVAVLLEAYTSECCEFYFENANAQQPPDEPYPAWRTGLPPLADLPDDADAWRAMDKRLTAKCLNFPNRVRASQNMISSAIEYTESELGLVLDEQACARGVEAWEIASSLRDTYKLERAEIVFDYHGVLQKALKISKQQREESDADQAAMMAELSADM